ncbi:MAG: dTMP kinase [Candidatus Tectomicrobia bacterium]|uniref:Thymidylate kinase n=1 Tax=Tectimicrobiota bacterium TaxID=2528274 RepID=A0A932FUJ9_UNCTE|nr:dTMP kinase [Candidatus Tectomicrobia bacterium]
MLIVFEGIDGAGKTTQLQRARDYLEGRGFEVVSLREPTEGTWGRRIRELAQQGRQGIAPREELDLFLQDRQENVRDCILPALDQKKIVLLDRYYYSNMAYQGALGLDPSEIQQLNERFAPRPDLVIVLQVPPSVGLSRLRAGRGGKIEPAYEEEAYLRRVKEIFDRLDEPHIRFIDASQPLPRVTAQITALLQEILDPSP